MMTLPILLQPVSTLLSFLSSPIYPPHISVSWIPLLHAARITVTYRSLRLSAGGRTSLMADLAGFLLMAWGGSIGSSVLLSLPMPQLLSFNPLLVYSLTYLVLADLKWLPSLKTLDTCMPLIDALMRTASIAASVELCRSHSLRAVSESFSIQLFIGAVASSGGGVSAQTLRVWEPVWRLCRPSFLHEGTLLAGTDVWSGVLVAAVYGCLTASHPAYGSIIALISPDLAYKPLLSPIDAKAAAACLLAIIYSWRAYCTHYSPKPTQRPPTNGKTTNEKTKPKKE